MYRSLRQYPGRAGIDSGGITVYVSSHHRAAPPQTQSEIVRIGAAYSPEPASYPP